MADPYSLGFHDPFNSMDPFDQLLGPVPRRATMPPMTPEEESLAWKALGVPLSLLSYVGETFSKPGKAVSGLLTGHPEELAHLIPFSDLLGITDSDGPLAPSGMLGGLGLHATDETKTMGGRDVLESAGVLGANTPGLDWGDAAGFAADVLLDPLMWTPAGWAGKAANAAKAIPGVAKGAEMLRYNKLINPVASTFDASLLGATSTLGQKAAPEVFDAINAGRVAGGDKVFRHAQALKDAGLMDDASSDLLRQAMELPHLRPQMPQAIQDIASVLDADNADLLARQMDIGIPTGPIQDPAGINFAHRQLSEGSRVGSKKAYPTLDPANVEREEILTGLKGGTLDIKNMALDPVIGGSARTAADNAAAQAHILQTYGSQFVRTGDELNSQVKGLADWLGRLTPEQAAKGAFGQHVLDDAGRHFMAGEQGVAAAKGIIEQVAKHAKDPGMVPLGSASKSVREILSAAGLRAGDANQGALNAIAKSMGKGWSKDLLNYRVPSDLADDLGRFLTAHSGPEAAGQLAGYLDNFTNMFKAGVLTWPARYVRDLFSGQFNNWVGGVFDPADLMNAGKIVRGGSVADAHSIPAVQKILRQRGLPETAENGTNVLRQMIASHELSGRHTHAATAASGPVSAAMDDLLGRMPGAKQGFRFGRDVAKEAIPKSLSEMNPLNIRGIGGRLETTLAPVKAGENMGYFTDSVNRIAPFITQLRKGVDPAEAAKKVMRLQVDYRPHTFTKTEQQVFKRLAPFYSFTRKTLPFVLSELVNKPGGKLAQTIKLTNNVREEGGSDFVPPHIGQGTAIPLGSEQEGHQRFLTGFGLPHEDILGLINFGPTALKTAEATGAELLGRLNPLVKAPAEIVAGKQFFTGRDLRDLTGSGEQLVENITGEKIGHYPMFEQVLSNSPLSRVLSSARTLTDSRKGPLAKATNLLSGARVSDVDLDKYKSIAARESLEELLRGNEGVSVFEHLSIPDEAMALMTPEQQQQARLYKTLGSRAQKDARERKKERAASF